MEQSRKFFWGILRSNKAPNASDLEVRVEVSSQAEIDFFLSFFQAVLAPPVESASDQNLPGASSPCTSTTSSSSTNHSHPDVHTDSPVPVNTAFLIVGLVCLVAVNIFFIIDIKLTLGRNSWTDEEDQWGFGQVLALLLLVVLLHDVWKAYHDIRNHFQQEFEQLFQTVAEAKQPERINEDLRKLIHWGANLRKPLSGPFANSLQMAAYYGKEELVRSYWKWTSGRKCYR
jgi:hypothetical protein